MGKAYKQNFIHRSLGTIFKFQLLVYLTISTNSTKYTISFHFFSSRMLEIYIRHISPMQQALIYISNNAMKLNSSIRARLDECLISAKLYSTPHPSPSNQICGVLFFWLHGLVCKIHFLYLSLFSLFQTLSLLSSSSSFSR